MNGLSSKCISCRYALLMINFYTVSKNGRYTAVDMAIFLYFVTMEPQNKQHWIYMKYDTGVIVCLTKGTNLIVSTNVRERTYVLASERLTYNCRIIIWFIPHRSLFLLCAILSVNRWIFCLRLAWSCRGLFCFSSVWSISFRVTSPALIRLPLCQWWNTE